MPEPAGADSTSIQSWIENVLDMDWDDSDEMSESEQQQHSAMWASRLAFSLMRLRYDRVQPGVAVCISLCFVLHCGARVNSDDSFNRHDSNDTCSII